MKRDKLVNTDGSHAKLKVDVVARANDRVKPAEYNALLGLYYVADAMALNLPQITAPWHKTLIEKLNEAHMAIWNTPRTTQKG
jgi:hypothetical protein